MILPAFLLVWSRRTEKCQQGEAVLRDTKVCSAKAQSAPCELTDEKTSSAITNESNLMGSQAASFADSAAAAGGGTWFGSAMSPSGPAKALEDFGR
jgi:hypothetical protein